MITDEVVAATAEERLQIYELFAIDQQEEDDAK